MCVLSQAVACGPRPISRRRGNAHVCSKQHPRLAGNYVSACALLAVLRSCKAHGQLEYGRVVLTTVAVFQVSTAVLPSNLWPEAKVRKWLVKPAQTQHALWPNQYSIDLVPSLLVYLQVPFTWNSWLEKRHAAAG